MIKVKNLHFITNLYITYWNTNFLNINKVKQVLIKTMHCNYMRIVCEFFHLGKRALKLKQFV